MTTTTEQIARRGSAAARGLTLERYVETMMPRYGSNSVKRWTRRGHYALEREDLLSEVALVLTEVWNKYSCIKPELELRKMGTGAIFKHISNVYHHTQAFGTKDARLVYLGSDEDQASPSVCPIERYQVKRYGKVESQLDSLVVREDLERTPVSDFRGTSANAVKKIFSDVVRAVRDDDGYSLIEAARKLNYTRDGGIRMNGGVTTGPQEPDTDTGQFTEEPPKEAPVAHEHVADMLEANEVLAKVAKVAKAKPAGKRAKLPGKRRVAATEAAERVGTFKKGQHVKYAGGGRAANLKAGTAMVVLGTITNRGRRYLRLSCGPKGSERQVVMSAARVSKV